MFPTTISSLTSPQSVSPESTAAWDCSIIPKLQLSLPGDQLPVWSMYGCSKDCLFLIPIRLPQFSCFTLSLRCFSSDSDKCGGRTPASVPPPAQGRSSPTNTPGYPSSSFILLLFAWFCVFFSTGQVLLSALSWCSICPSACEGGFLMYPWREMNSTFTHSSAILFYPCQFNFLILTYYYYISQTFPSILTSR